MIIRPKFIFMALLAVFFIAGCNSSASSDAKKVEVKKVVASAQATTAKIDDSTVKTDKMTKIDSSEFQQGKHFVAISPEMQTDAGASKVEVVELFWLGCSHCYKLEPTMLKYKNNHPDYVDFKQVPAMLNPSWAADANTFFIAKILDPKNEKDLVTRIFQSIHDQKRRLHTPKAVARFFVEQGYTEEQINNAKNSIEFQAKLVRAQEVSAASQASSVPTLIINGKYRTSPYMAGGNEQLMKIVDMLTKREKRLIK